MKKRCAASVALTLFVVACAGEGGAEQAPRPLDQSDGGVSRQDDPAPTDAGEAPEVRVDRGCNPVANIGCGRGRICRWNLRRDRFECATPPDEPVALEAPCDGDDDQCGPGLVCHDGTCLAVCDAEASTCDALPGSQRVGHFCRPVPGASAAKVCVGSPCTPSDDRCAAGEVCVPAESDGSIFRCIAAGTQGRGEACGPDDGNCDKGLICLPAASGGMACVEVCQAGVRGSCSQTGDVCVAGRPGGVAFDVCLPACDPLDYGCPEGEACTPVSSTEFACAPAGPNGLGATCGGAAGLCQRGTWCLPDGKGSGECVAYCDQADPMACDGAARCVELVAPALDRALGFCAPGAPCELFRDTCPAGEACYPLSFDQFSCAPEGTRPVGATCDGHRNACVAGAFCVSVEETGARSVQVCDLANPECRVGQRCVGTRGVDFGICVDR